MSRVSIVVVALVVAVVVGASLLAGCGGSDEGAATENPAATAAATGSPVAEDAPTGTWTTVTTLKATDPANAIGILVSEEFAVRGDVRVVLKASDGGEADGVVGTIMPASAEITVDAAAEGEPVTVAKAAPKQVIAGLDGTYVFVVSVSTGTAWTVDIQTRQ